VSLTPDEPEPLAREAAAIGQDLVACGGDGLVAAVTGVAADTGRRLAIVPTGAGNDFARGLGYDPKHRLDAFGALEHGRDRVVGQMTRAQMLLNFPKVFKGTHTSHPKVSTFRAARVELESRDTSVPMDVYADGERVGPLPAAMEALRNALTVRVP